MNEEHASLGPGLYLIATPIGTARDITLRALDLLRETDVLVAEDTRSLKRLMDIHGIDLNGRPVLSYHDHSGPKIRPKIIERIQAGQSVLYASEAGSPMVADPGYNLVRDVIEADLPLICAPGPSATIAALCLSGLPTDQFLFAGFLPTTESRRKSALEDLSGVPATLIFYESPHRIKALLQSALEVLGSTRKAVLCREITKRFEEVLRGTIEELLDAFGDRVIKGELVLLIDRGSRREAPVEEVHAALSNALNTMSVRDAAEHVARAFDLKKRDVYQQALKLTKGE
ncbi:MAG: 16S rRNA (cytidine(1402)-2'-O)-methyltransferase [Pseudomonadota bacterium]